MTERPVSGLRSSDHDPVVVADRLGRRFGSLEAVKDVSFTIARGEVFGFLGPNGAGKTTTINMLCTLLRPTTGGATLNGYDVRRQRSDVRRSIGLVFQQTTLDEYLSAEQNLRFHAYAYGIGRDEREHRMRRLLEMVDLWDRRSTAVRYFSGGMKRRLEIARGLLHHPTVLFLDEPTLGLDPQTRRSIWDYLLELRARENLTIFLTTHYMDEAEHADRIAVIDHGAIVALDSPAALKARVGGDLVTLSSPDAATAVAELQDAFAVTATRTSDDITFTVPDGETFLPRLLRTASFPIASVSLRRPTLDDVFVHLTGREIRDEEVSEHDQLLATIGRRHRA